MKKLVLILVMMATMNFGYAMNNFEDNGCFDWAVSATNAEEDAYGTMDDDTWVDIALEYWDDCDAAGGASHMMGPVFM